MDSVVGEGGRGAKWLGMKPAAVRSHRGHSAWLFGAPQSMGPGVVAPIHSSPLPQGWLCLADHHEKWLKLLQMSKVVIYNSILLEQFLLDLN